MTTQEGKEKPRGPAQVTVENIGGIDRSDVTLTPGVTVLSGRNATNRSSFLRSVMAAMGSDLPALKGDAEEGRVELALGEDTYTRTFRRTDHGVVTGGDPYLEDASDADLFAFLLEDNEARRAVERGDDLREVMLRPVDTDRIESDITRLRAERDEIDRQLEELEGLRHSHAALEEEQARVSVRIDEAREALEEMDDATLALEEGLDHEAELESVLGELREERAALEDARYELETERTSVEDLREELERIGAELDELEDVEAGGRESIDDRIETLREERAALETEINQLGTVSEFNRGMLEGHSGIFAGDGGSVTDALVEEAADVTCWTCGMEVDVAAIETTLDHLEERRQEMVERHAEVTEELKALRQRRNAIERQRVDRERLAGERDAITAEIARREERIGALEATQAEGEERVEALEAEVTALEREDYDELLERHREANEREFEVQRLEDELERIEGNIAELDSQLDRQTELEERRETIADELVDLRTRVDRIEEEAVAAFNEHMAELLALLGYENIARVWIERREETVREGRGTREHTVFEHHVVRTAEDGSTYEDTVEHLSESEREVIGLVFALAGYLVHELHERVPFVLLDSLEVIDSDRIAAVVEYFESYAEYLVVALLPEDAAALGDDIEYVTEI